MNYRVILTDDAEADMDGLSPNTKSDVNAVFRRLRSGTDPDLDLRLEDTDGLWRAYAGRRWRVVFEVLPGREIVVRRIRRRRDAYEGIEHLHRRDVRETEGSYESVQPPPIPSPAGRSLPRPQRGVVALAYRPSAISGK